MQRFFVFLLLFSNISFKNVDLVESLYLVSISDWCVGAIIDKQFVLTSAYCVVSNHSRDVHIANIRKLVSGTYDINFKEDPKRQEMKVERICIPDNYKPPKDVRTLNLDIAIIKLKEKLNETENGLESLQLPREYVTDSYAGELALVSGFRGELFQMTHNYKSLNDNKYYGSTVKIIKQKDCSNKFSNITDDCNVCSVTDESNMVKPDGACNYGAPLVGRKNQLMGLAIFVNCDETKVPTIYTNVAYYLEIIRKTMKDVVTGGELLCRNFTEGDILYNTDDKNNMNLDEF